ncbi:protein of unknown function [Thiomonas sp. OC7]|nr:protein of unknown function [Thiomonas sp. Sup16B3]VDY12775.1 protein of unknown function [Thiomonas sp. OC7]
MNAASNSGGTNPWSWSIWPYRATLSPRSRNCAMSICIRSTICLHWCAAIRRSARPRSNRPRPLSKTGCMVFSNGLICARRCPSFNDCSRKANSGRRTRSNAPDVCWLGASRPRPCWTHLRGACRTNSCTAPSPRCTRAIRLIAKSWRRRSSGCFCARTDAIPILPLTRRSSASSTPSKSSASFFLAPSVYRPRTQARLFHIPHETFSAGQTGADATPGRRA